MTAVVTNSAVCWSAVGLMSSLDLEWLLSMSDAGGGHDAILIDLSIESEAKLGPMPCAISFPGYNV